MQSGQTLSARSFRADLQPSTVSSGAYTLQVAQPVFSPDHGPITNGTMIAMTTITPGATIRYALDGSDPNPSSTAYTAPFSIQSKDTVSARGYRAGFNDSPIQRVYFSGATNITTFAVLSGTLFYFIWPSDTGRTYQA